MRADVVRLEGSALRVEVAELGAELVQVQDAEGHDLLWNGDPAFWTGRAPLLFPMVGRARGDRIRVEGRDYALPQHGFARTSRFTIVERSGSSCTMQLCESEDSLSRYPYPFRLDVTYTVHEATLRAAATVSNTGERWLPVSFGFHPAFRWPLLPGVSREAHEIVFERPEIEPVRRPVDGLLGLAAYPTPVRGRRLALHDSLFADGALIFDRLDSRSAIYGAPGSAAVQVSFPGMPHLGIWTKPGAGFVCLEPWQGFASPEDFDGEFADRPGIVPIAPGDAKTFAMAITLQAAFDVVTRPGPHPGESRE